MNISEYDWLEKIYNRINFDKLPHGIIINGPDGIGKEVLATHIAQKLLLNKTTKTYDKSLVDSNTHPDLFILNKDKILLKHITYRKTVKKEDWDEQFGDRNINQFLSVTPSVAINKVVIILNAQNMNLASQNAILKSLEEPSPNSFIVFTINRPMSLLKTVYSRCQIISIPSLDEASKDQWLSKNGISDYNSSHFPSFISPLKILDEIQDNQHLNFIDFIKIISDFIENKIDCNFAIKKINNLNIDLITKTNYLVEFLKIILKSRIISEELSGLYKKFNDSKFNNLKISNILNDLNNLRSDYFKVPQINETHVLNYFLSELKSSIKI